MRDTRVYVHAVWRLLTDRVLPLDFAAYARDLLAELDRLQAALGERLSLDGLVGSATALRDNAARLATAALDAARINQALMRVSRALVPINYTSGDRFAHDPAVRAAGLADAACRCASLHAAVPGSDAARFLAVGAVRARNRIAHALREANAVAEDACRS